jgi:chromosome segregation ATPase
MELQSAYLHLRAESDQTERELQLALQRVVSIDLDCKEQLERAQLTADSTREQATRQVEINCAEHVQSLVAALASLQDQLFESDRERKELEAEHEMTRRELQKSLQRVASLDLECKEKETRFQTAQREAVAIHEQEISELRSEVESRVAERTQSLVAALASLQAQLLESDRERKEIEAGHDMTQQELQKSLQRVAFLDLECKEKETQLKNSEAAIQEQAISAARNEVESRVAERTQSLSTALASLQAQLFESDRERKEIEAEHDRTQQELQKALQRVASLDLECKEKETQLKNAEATAHEQTISALRSEAERSFYQRTQALRDALARLQAQLLESDRDRKEIEAEHDMTRQELQKALQRVASLDLECKQRETVENARVLDIETDLRAMVENNATLEARLATRDADCEATKQDLERVKAEHETEQRTTRTAHDQAIDEVRRNYSDALASFQAQLLEAERQKDENEAEHERTQQELHNALQRVVDLGLELRDQKSNIAIGKYVTKTSREQVPEFSERLAALSACQEPDEKCGQRFFQFQQDTDDHRDMTHSRKLFTKLAMLTKDICELDEPKRKRTRKQTEFYGK